MKKQFKDFALDVKLITALESMGFSYPTEIQEMTLEHILKGQDISALAETGSGKTGSFAIPIINMILERNDDSKYIVLSPTRELAQQTDKVFNQIGKVLDIRTCCIIGGERIEKQIESLEYNPQVIVATPGRLLDVIGQKLIDPSKVVAVVFDEADRLFDMGFKKDIEQILKGIPDTRQLIMVSATTNMDVLSTAYKFRSNPTEIKLNSDSLLVDNIDHKIAMIEGNEKVPFLVNILRKHEDAYAIIFCNTQYQTHLLAEWLRTMDFKAMPISGRLAQNKRTKLMEDFHAKKITILVCTDVAARGLDIKDVNLVVNFDLPQEAANYVHRIGRTGRAGKDGEAISFCSFEDCEHLDGINELIGSSIPKMDFDDNSFAKNITKRPYIDSKTLQIVDRNKPSRDRKDTKKGGKTFVDNKVLDLKLNIDRPFSQSEKITTSKEFFVTTDNLESVTERALNFFQVNDASLLQEEITVKGRKKFFFFGPRTNEYKITLKPIYKKLLLPFLIDMITISNLKLRVKVSFSRNIYISFEGQDANLISKNDDELAKAIEQVCKLYLLNKIRLSRGVKIFVKTNNTSKEELAILKSAKQIRDEVIKTNQSLLMDPLNAAQRRIVHELLSKDKAVKTSSIGDGRMKQIEISPV